MYVFRILNIYTNQYKQIVYIVYSDFKNIYKNKYF